jgi:hypothetical protein
MERWMRFAKMSASSPEISSSWANFVDVCICVPSQHFSSILQDQDSGLVLPEDTEQIRSGISVSIADNMNPPSPPFEPAFVFDMRYQTGKWRTTAVSRAKTLLVFCIRDVDVLAGNWQQQQEQQCISAAVPQHRMFYLFIIPADETTSERFYLSRDDQPWASALRP